MTRSEFDTELEARLLRYAAIDSQSDASSASQPSTDIQLDMSRLLLAELSEMGAQDVELTDYGVVLATIPATAEGPVMGWCAHVDTAPQFNATSVKPVVHRGYNGGDITFADAPDLKLSPENSPYLGEKQGEDIITASGLTLLGGDDKAGVAIAMTAARHLLQNPQIKHGAIRLAFTPDEEIGRGVDARLPADFGVDFAYTFDGGKPGEIEFETFSADGAVVRVTGVSAHPGFAKDKMVNALHLASKIVMTLPHVTMTPETTQGTEGFIHVSEMTGGSSEAEIVLIIRDFELEGLAAKGDLLRQVCAAVAAGEPRAQIACEITPQYRNMRYWLEKDMTPVDLVRAAVADVGLDPVSVPIRGGTDGSRLTEMGVPCPNVFTGMQEIHGPLEWISVQDMALATKVAIALAQRAVS
ncbi:peptidase T [Sulfitobacter sp. M57]|uniref:peptidase T n=1 Tax=unclassified Sulfitobacter TaxID=196795 RepID=UPI0023E090C2|nr:MULTISPECIES: peptidase T [unclassified Sulfitobacter]MDF3414287.1 peptidase T [Sulfitobacter sp. KE5]MDF3420431.1 peptidase T [Sulfitobacter sp. KE43]MDF3432833.1 peptidase T [Sulfitobacter sp. KE42]MDF3458473.1 peptidase T [Sulfitobacter sp. S74]MDF3462373.1 peptidase T [Sulfitobacter sp. Ks18]